MNTLIVLAGVLAAVSAQNTQRTTPVPILKQINRHNDDGSYTYGYEGADGSFKIETKHANGEVHGKYGYIGDDGKVREIEYGASRRGFEPAGTDINVPPPVVSPGNELDYDDGQYKDDPDYYNEYKNPKASRQPAHRVFKSHPRPAAPTQEPFRYNPPAAPVQEPFRYNPPAPEPIRYSSPAAPAQEPFRYSPPAAAPQPIRYSSPAVAPAPQWNPPPTYYPTPRPYAYQNAPAHHAANVNLQTGSYSLSYVG